MIKTSNEYPKIEIIKIGNLIKADWNYKSEGTQDMIEKLARSIEEDKSAGIPAVRELNGTRAGKYEIIDGNHRLDALLLLGWKEVQCENFGKISKAKAILISKRRNTQWFKDNLLKSAELFTNDVLPEIPLDQICKFMPESKESLEYLKELMSFNWNQ